MFSSFILFVDIVVISFVCKIFKNKNKRVYIFIFQSIISAIVYFGINYMFENANKWNEYTINNNQNISDPNTPSSQKNTN